MIGRTNAPIETSGGSGSGSDGIFEYVEGASGIFPDVFFKSINFPKGVTRIGNSAFKYWTSLTNITIPEGVTYIDQEAFYYCSNLTSIILPKSLNFISVNAFANCNNLTIKYRGTESEWVKIGRDTNWSNNTTVTMVYNYTN